jgi:hypothetical protein
VTITGDRDVKLHIHVYVYHLQLLVVRIPLHATPATTHSFGLYGQIQRTSPRLPQRDSNPHRKDQNFYATAETVSVSVKYSICVLTYMSCIMQSIKQSIIANTNNACGIFNSNVLRIRKQNKNKTKTKQNKTKPKKKKKPTEKKISDDEIKWQYIYAKLSTE